MAKEHKAGRLPHRALIEMIETLVPGSDHRRGQRGGFEHCAGAAGLFLRPWKARARTDAGMYLHAGPEIGVASTKAFTCQAQEQSS